MSARSDRSFLDTPDFRKTYQLNPDQAAMKFYVEGIKCGRCVQKIESLEKKIVGIQSLQINMSTHQLAMILDDAQISFVKAIDEIENLGFKLTPIKSSDLSTGLMEKEDRQDLLRLAVAAACAGNIMMFSFAVYFGADGYLETLFKWLSFMLYLPVLIYVAKPFYQGFISAFQQRTLSVDGPIAIASAVGFIFSSLNLFRGTGSIYYDSLSGFLFLILVSRFIQKRLQRSFLSFQNAVPIDFMTRARKQNKDLIHFEWVPSESLQIADCIQVQKGESIPVDGVLISDSIQVDSSYLTGESKALFKNKNMTIEAGSVLLSDEAIVSVTAINEKTHFGKLLQEIQIASIQKVGLQKASDRYSQVLLIVVYLSALVFILITWSKSPEVALERALALIILACPCAMAFGTPLAIAFSVQNASKKGFLIKSGDVFEKILKVKTVFFDKTGTLTGNKLKVVSSFPSALNQHQASLILGLESISTHPIANALRDFLLPSFQPAYTVENSVEVPGVGVQGDFQNKKYSIQSSENETQKKSVALFENSVPLVHFYLEDTLLKSSRIIFQRLVEKKISVQILSGDSAVQVEKIAGEIGLGLNQCFAGMTAAEKAKRVSEFENTMMIGDGINDSLAFKKADVGIAVNGCIPLALKSADVYLLFEDLSYLDQLFTISERAVKLVHRNLFISLAYNAMGGAAALMGYINPFVAAVLMPISSGFILLSCWIESRR